MAQVRLTPQASSLQFEAASLRLAAPVVGVFAAGPYGGPGSSDPIRITGINLTLKALLMNAYNVRYEQISGPGWIESQGYDLQATVLPGATKEQIKEMLRNVLNERFKLNTHHETRSLPLFELVTAKGRVKFKESSSVSGASTPGTDAQAATPFKPGSGFPEIHPERTTGLWQMISPGSRVRIVGRNQPISELVRALGNQAGRPVIDATGLPGKYDYTLEYALVVGTIGTLGMPMPAPSPDVATVERELNAAPDLATALQEQLGLKLQAKNGPLDVLVVDQAEKVPIDN